MKLMVLDGNSIINRAFYGVRPLSTRDGTPTNAVYGFINILLKLLNDEAPDALCVTFDLKGPTFRHEAFEAYKAQRKPMPDELAAQLPILKDVLTAMNIPRYELSGWEADDLIGTIACRCEAEGWECVIVTGDKDSFQLITETTHVKHVKSRMGQTETNEYDIPSFTAEYGFEPKKMVDLKALMGDASDNIPGVSGIGEKTALELVQKFGTIAEIYKSLDSLPIRDTVRKKLEAGREAARMSYELATIRCEAPIEFYPADNLRRAEDKPALYELFQKLEFTKLTERFGLTPPVETCRQEVYEAECVSTEISTPEEAAELERALSAVPWVAVHTDPFYETIAVVTNTGTTAYILRRGVEASETALRFVMSDRIQKVGHDIKDFQRRLLDMGIVSDGWIFDTALAAYLLSPTESFYGIRKLAEQYAGIAVWAGEEQNGQLMLQDDVKALGALLSEAAAIALLKDILASKLTELCMDELFYQLELPLCPVLAQMEHEGFLVDRQALFDFGEKLSLEIQALEKNIYELAGESFNVNSPKQLGAVLFEKLMLPAPKKTKTGYSTNVEVLEALLGKHPIIRFIMEYRELTKLKSTYADGLLKVIAPDGRIHTNFQMTVTATGRLSSTDPNLQNIPIRRALGGELRKMFVAGEGKVLVDADYSQIELRLLAHISGDETMRAAFINGEDIHTVTASQVLGKDPRDVTPVERSRAKAVNFGIVYGISAFSLSQDIGVTVNEAKQYIAGYLGKYSGVRDYMKNIVEQAKTDGYVTTLFHRRRYLPELKASNFSVRSFGERVALNMPIQGTAADIMKLAMIHVSERIHREGFEAKLLLQVHDELIVECPEAEAERVARLLDEEMEHVASFSVPLTAESHIGKSWYEAK